GTGARAVWKLNRLSRSRRDVPTIMERPAEAEAGFRSVAEATGATARAGGMMRRMAGAFTEFERACLAGAPSRIGCRALYFFSAGMM
ncbi:MAG: recombinase family protein, partial [Bryobacteraceae bacterium]